MDKKSLLEQIEKSIRVCQKCRLFKTAKNPVPGEGNIDSEIMFVGEAPGQVEDDTGRPFVGRAGMLLESLLREIGYKRTDVWIGNILKHRPPENRDPLPDEAAACEGYLTMQLNVIKPLLVVTLGRYAMSYFYKDGKISKDRGRLIRAGKYNIYPVYHPAAALRNPELSRALREDFMRIPEVLKRVKEGNFASFEESNSKNENVDGQLGFQL